MKRRGKKYFQISLFKGIRLKLETAQRHDKPRWGDYPEKLDLDYIQGIDKPRWVDYTEKLDLDYIQGI